ncbi:uncharacterized protein EMH_0057280 [Eimeria mitis]|uniref:Secreted protein n=1 Tax=Eimeria mitis TaxID=44415 RepID=U6K238_9EIME|nr:uncharacterized protein EMH_0057280 [Eimeria mitis]CDJ30337.1 hypothetical protein EMH_0057280 [Eimeria mitis]
MTSCFLMSRLAMLLWPLVYGSPSEAFDCIRCWHEMLHGWQAGNQYVSPGNIYKGNMGASLSRWEASDFLDDPFGRPNRRGGNKSGISSILLCDQHT